MKSATIMRAAGESEKKLSRRFAFTVERLAGIKPPASGRTYVYDTQAPHLAYMVTDKGATSYLWYGRIDGKPIRGRLGSGTELNPVRARTLCGNATAAVLTGGNPFAKVVDESMTLGALYDWYEAAHAKPHKSSWTNDRAQFNVHLAKWKDRQVKTIDREDVRKLHAKIGEPAPAGDGHPTTANRILAMLSTVFNKALNANIIKGDNPTKGITRYRESARERFLSADELNAFNKALDDEPSETMRDFFRLALWTGGRRSNVLSMRWDEIDLDGKVWKIPAEKAKAGQTIDVPLSAPALEILTRRRKAIKGQWVFPSHSKSGHLQEPKKAWDSLLKRANLADLRLHDLRRTFGSWQAATGASNTIIGKGLGHRNQATTAIYARLNIEPVRQAVDLATLAMQAAMQDKPATAKKTKGKGGA